MRRALIILLSILILSAATLNAAISKTVNITAGGLSAALSSAELTTVTDLTITGTIDARDFKTMRDDMTMLAVVDITDAYIVEYAGSEGTWTDTEVTYPANTVPHRALSSKTTLTSVSLPSSVTSISDSAFYACSLLTTMNLPSLLISIEAYAFYSCSKLETVDFPSTLTSIGKYAYFSCKALTTVEVPASVNSIGEDVFFNCTGLTSVIFSASLATLPKNSFIKCSNLTTIDMSSSTIEEIDIWAFYYCEALTSVTLPSNILTLGYGSFQNCSSLESISLPSSLVSIGQYAFCSCTSLSSISLPASLKSIGYRAFYKCSSLTSIDLPYSLTSINSYAFYNAGLTSVIIPSQVTTLKDNTFYNCTSLAIVKLPEAITEIEEGCFSGCTNLESLYVYNPKPVYISPDDDIFKDVATGSCKLYVPEGSVDLYDTASVWKDFTSIIEIKVDGDLSPGAGGLSGALTDMEKSTIKYLTLSGEIDARDFKTMRDDMDMLQSVDIHDATIIEYTGTGGTRSTASFTYGADHIPTKAFLNKKSLQSVLLSPSFTSIRPYAFQNTELTTINIPDSIVSILDQVFYDCSNLRSVIFNDPDSLSFGIQVFQNSYNLTTIQIPEPVTAITSKMFYGCSGLTSVTLPETLSEINSSAFHNCTALENIEIPETVDSIYSSAFYNCSGLTKIYANRTIPQVLNPDDNVFFNVDTVNCALIAPESSSSLYSSAEVWKDFTNTLGFEHEITVNVSTAGTLNEVLTGTQKQYANKIIITGDIDARDFKTMRDSMPSLEYVDLSDANIVHYYGDYGTASSTRGYDANEIPYYALFKNEKIHTLKIPESTINIEDNAFYLSYGLTSFSIPNSVTTIGDASFFWCTSLKKVYIPASVTKVGDQAFSGCTVLSSIYSFAKTPVDLSSSEDVFYNVDTTTCILYVPASSVELYREADQWKKFLHIEAISNSLTVLSTDTIYFEKTANETTISVKAHTTWQAASNEEWLVLSDTSYTGYGNLRITSDENPEITSRTAHVKIWINEIDTVTITVIQAAGDTTLTAAVSELKLGASAASADASILSNTSWLASSSQSWLTLSQTSATGNANLTISVEANTTGAYRTALVILSASGADNDTITVTQLDEDPSLSASETSIDITSAATTSQITITSNISWSAISDQVWLTVSPASGTGNTTLELSADENTTEANRSATVTLSANGVDDVIITITQSVVTGIEYITDNSSVTIYPNPVSNSFTITGIENNTNMKLFDINGRKVLTQIVDNNEEVSVSNLSEGIYLMSLQLKDNMIFKKLIKQ